MRRAGGYAAAAFVLAVAGTAALAAGVVEHRLARAEEMLMSLNFAGTTAAYDELAQYAGYARYVPWIGGEAFDRIRARRAAARYWDGDHDALAAVARDAGAAGNGNLLFVAANSLYRLAHSRAADDPAVLRGLDDARAVYVEVMKGGGNPDAAFNYEYVGLVRDEIARGRRGTQAGAARGGNDRRANGIRGTLHGREGGPPPGRPGDEFKIYVPTETEEQKGLEPGGEQLRRRKG